MNSCKKAFSGFVLFDNVVLHVLILFSLLSCLFLFYISKLTSKSINDTLAQNIDSAIDPKEIKKILNEETNNTEYIDQLVGSVSGTPDWLISLLNPNIVKFLTKIRQPISDMFKVLSDNFSSNEDPLRKQTNKGIVIQICLVIGFLLLITIIINVMSVKSGTCGVLKHLGIELLIVFILIGIIEVWFFMNVASKYVPVTPDIIVKAFKEHMNSIIHISSSS